MQYPKGTNILGYLVDYLVSETAMATIYCVEHRALRSKHAIKFLNPQFADVPSIRAVYGREMQTLSDLRSPYLVRITEVINSKWGLGIVMDWLDGETLETYLRKVDGVTAFFAVKWACQILSALQLYHQNDLLHLGICPHNIFLEKVEGGRVAVLMDHNIGRRMEQGKRKPSFNLESSYYRSPEQINAPRLLGISSDVYSVGVLLYRMLTGKLPFKGDTEYQIMHSIVSDEIPPFPEDLDVPDGLEQVVRKAMSRDISERYQTAFEFLEALRSLFSQPLLEGAVSEQVVVEMIEKQDGSSEFEMAEDDEETKKKEKTVKSFFRGKKQKDATRISSPSNKGPPKTATKAAKKKSKGKNPPEEKESKPIVIWLPNRWYSLAAASIVAGAVLVQGGLLGRDTKIFSSEAPDWGKTEAFLDGEKQPQDKMRQSKDDPELIIREYSKELGLGEHQFLIQGGVWRRNSCNRCCWKQEQLFSVPFGFGTHDVSLEFTDKQNEPNCPSLEQDFYFSELSTGTFLMGSPRELFMRGHDELWHVVQISHPFYLSKHEVTQELFERVMGRNPSLHRGEKLPVENVSWLDAVEFCNKLSEAEGLDTCYDIDGSNVYWESGFACNGYRLPTEAEWEYAAKASSLKYEEITIRRTELTTGKSSSKSGQKGDKDEYLYFGGKNPSLISWYAENAQRKTHPVGTKYPNEWGLYDMSGNVSEWTWDLYGSYAPEAIDPKGASSGRKRVIRGGNYSSTPREIRVSTREQGEIDLFTGYIGFRIARSLH